MKKLQLTIEGMHCASCATNVEKSLKKLKGVIDASVNLMARKGFVEVYDGVSQDDIKKSVSKVGYKVVKIEED